MRYFFRSWKALSHSSSHLSHCAFLIALKKGLHRLVDHERKRLRAVACSIKLRIAWICLGYASIPRWVTRYPKNLPKDTSNVHLKGLSFILYFLRMSKVFAKLSMLFHRYLPFTMMSSTYTSMVTPICFLNILFTNLW